MKLRLLILFYIVDVNMNTRSILLDETIADMSGRMGNGEIEINIFDNNGKKVVVDKFEECKTVACKTITSSVNVPSSGTRSKATFFFNYVVVILIIVMAVEY